MSTVTYRDASDGTTLLVRRWAAPDQPVGTVVVVHGLNEHSGRYEYVGDRLTTAGYRVVGYDHRGFGRSGGRTRSHVESFSQLVDDLADLLADERSDDGPTVVLGHSMGGLVSVAHAVSDHPHPDAYVVSAPPLGVEVPWWQRLAASVLSRVAPRASVAGAIDSTTLSRDPAVQRGYDEDPLVQRSVSARLGAEMFTTMDRVEKRLDRLDRPMLVLHGGEDVLVHPRFSAALGSVDGVRRELLPGLRHEILNEPERDEVIDKIITWLQATLHAG